MISLEFSKLRYLSRARKSLAAIILLVSCVGLYVLAFGVIVVNGTTSLPHNGYFMVNWPLIAMRGAYVSFDIPVSVSSDYKNYSFLKRVVGLPGDYVSVEGSTVCVQGSCRDLLHDLVEGGIAPIAQGPIPAGHYFVLGDSADSLDSRYEEIGFIPHSSLQALGFPAPLPHWKEIHSWFSHD